MRKMMISLEEKEFKALKELAKRERRTGRSQAVILIRATLERLGYLSKPNSIKTPLEND